MADTIFQGGMKALVEGDLQTGADVRLALVTASFTGASEEDAVNLADFTTLGEFGGVGYQRIDCAGVTVTYDSSADEYRLDFDDDEFNASGSTVAAGPAAAAGILVILHVDGTEANDIAIGHTDSGGFPVNASNIAMTLTVPSGGLMYLGAA